MADRAFSFLKTNQRQAKPRSLGLTEIRGPYYTPIGKRYLQDVLETIGEHAFVDHSQIVQLECLRSGIWGTAATWGRVLTYKDEAKKLE